MKALYIALLFCGLCKAQSTLLPLNSDAYTKIINLELSRQAPGFISKKPNAVVGDSIVLHKDIWHFESSFSEFKSFCIASEGLTAPQAEEIFGRTPDKNFQKNTLPRSWNTTDFPGQKVFLFDNNIHVLYSTTRSQKNEVAIGTGMILSLSHPSVRDDGKYALIETFSQAYGCILSIYKKNETGWELYKLIIVYQT